VQCDIRVPFRLGDAVHRPSDRPFRAVVELALPSSPGAVPVDGVLIREEVREWLGTVGVTPVETADADPGSILHLRVEVQVSRTEDGLDLCFLKERCSLWEDRNLAGNDPGKPQRIGYISHFVGKKGGGGVQDLVRSTLQMSLHEFLEAFPPLYTAEKATKATKQSPAAPPAMDFDFSQIKVKHQPPAPGYPVAAKMRRIQGTVVVALTIDPTGRPVLADALSGPYELLQTAVRYALTWEFEPARLNGVPQYARFKLTMPFRLRGPDPYYDPRLREVGRGTPGLPRP
jgi:TonB family protein